MDEFATEEQQEEAIKRFLKENGVAIIAGAVIGIGGLWGWQTYTDTQINGKEAASIQYQKAVETAVSDDSTDALATFTAESENKGYTAISSLVLAKEYVDAANLEGAADVLENVVVSEAGTPLGSIAAIRLAAIQMEQEQYDAVLSTVERVTGEAFLSQSLSLKGDALSALTRIDEAKSAYIAALEKSPENQQVQMKLDNLELNTGA